MDRYNRFLMIVSIGVLIIYGIMMNLELQSYAAEDNSALNFNSIVEVESYSIEERYIEAGKEANIILTIHNANKYSAANNMLLIVSSDSKMIYPTYGNDNQFVIGTLEANETRSVSIPVIISPSFAGEYIDLNCKLMYESGGRQISNESTIVLPTKGKDLIEVNLIDVNSNAVVNAESPLSISYFNRSEYNIDDALLIIDGNVDDSTSSIDLGLLAAGKSYSKDFNITFTELGEQSIKIYLKYNDNNGEMVQSDLGTFSVSVTDNSDLSPNEADSNVVFLILCGRLIAVIALIVVGYMIYKYIKRNWFSNGLINE